MERNPVEVWEGEFGDQYTDRNRMTVQEYNEFSEERFGISRTERMEYFLDDLDREIKILEVGTNIGSQLKCLQELGFENLYGIDVQRTAINEAHETRPELDVIQGNACDIPFKDNFFDLVFTSTVLIHIPPEKLEKAMSEIVRCSSQWVYGHEYYAEDYTEVDYRGHDGLLWKGDFPEMYMDDFDLELNKIKYLDFVDEDNKDVEFLLEKQ